MDDGDSFDLPPEHEAGVYANTFTATHTEHDFTLDFAIGTQDRPALVVSRVRIPSALAFELIQRIHIELSHYEREWGEIRRPRRRGEEGKWPETDDP